MADANPTTLPCSRCKQVKPFDQFRRRPNRPETGERRGRWSHCMDCERANAKLPHRRVLANLRAAEFKTRLRERDYVEFRRRERQCNLKRTLGITDEDYQALLAAQGGKCAICEGPPRGNRWRLDEHGNRVSQAFSVDHCHKTGKIRSLLCGHCNTGLGHFRDDPELMRKAAAYIETQSQGE